MSALLEADRSLLLVVDVQERLAPAMDGGDAALARTLLLVEAARTLRVPIVVSEQYPAGLGPTLAPLLERLGEVERLPKTHFSCADDPAIRERVFAAGRRQIIVVGMEAHVCVLQSALGFAAQGLATYVVDDAVASRRASDKSAGLARMRDAGTAVVTSEMVVFEWLGRAGTPEFKALSRAVK